MYTLTLIRLDSNTRVFQNTEFHSICLLGDIEKELANHHVPFYDVERVFNMKKGDRLTIEVDNSEKLWFYYINRIN